LTTLTGGGEDSSSSERRGEKRRGMYSHFDQILFVSPYSKNILPVP
jgi:hypothetical protein